MQTSPARTIASGQPLGVASGAPLATGGAATLLVTDGAADAGGRLLACGGGRRRASACVGWTWHAETAKQSRLTPAADHDFRLSRPRGGHWDERGSRAGPTRASMGGCLSLASAHSLGRNRG